MSDGEDDRRPCAMCGSLDRDDWIILSRYVLGTSKSYAFLEARDDDDAPGAWQAPQGQDDAGAATGQLLCVPDCLILYLRGKGVEVEMMAKGDGHA